MKKVLPIVYSIDDNYTLPLLVAIRSLQLHKKKEFCLKIYIFNAGLKDENKQKLSLLEKDDCIINFVSVKDYLVGTNFYFSHNLSEATYYRFFIPIILKQYEKVLYLDVDTIVKNCVSKIFEEDLTGFALAGCFDFGMIKNGEMVENDYINAGMILFNCNEFIKNNFSQKCVDFVNANQNLSYHDQDAINIVCKTKKKIISSKFNFITPLYWDYEKWGNKYKKGIKLSGIKNLKSIYVYHFAGTKPWAIKNTPLSKLWWNVAKTLPKEIREEINNFHLIKRQETIEYYNTVVSKKYYNGYIVAAQRSFFEKIKIRLSKLLRR